MVKEIGGGDNDARPKVLKLLTDPTLTLIAARAPRTAVLEHKDRLIGFGFDHIELLLKLQDR